MNVPRQISIEGVLAAVSVAGRHAFSYNIPGPHRTNEEKLMDGSINHALLDQNVQPSRGMRDRRLDLELEAPS